MKYLTILRRHWLISTLLALLLAVLIVLRLYMNVWVLDYVNNVLNHIEGFKGAVQAIDIDLYRGAYRIRKLKLLKTSGRIPAPFVAVETVDLSVQWRALLHGRVVSNIELYKPVLTFAMGEDSTKQTGAGVDWTQPIKALSPVDINRVTFKDGEVTYKDFSTTPKVNIFIHHMVGEVRNLRNVVNAAQPLPSTLTLSGDSIGGGKLKMGGRLNILKQVPDMDIKTELENVRLQALNDYSNAYAAIDIKGGNVSVYSEVMVKNGEVSGYIKPVATNISLIDLNKSANPVKVAWESLVSVVLKLFTNLPKDQLATKIQLEGNLDNIHTDVWSTIGGILHNAFIGALKKGLDGNVKGNAS